jgi:hypothetical protein
MSISWSSDIEDEAVVHPAEGAGAPAFIGIAAPSTFFQASSSRERCCAAANHRSAATASLWFRSPTPLTRLTRLTRLTPLTPLEANPRMLTRQ